MINIPTLDPLINIFCFSQSILLTSIQTSSIHQPPSPHPSFRTTSNCNMFCFHIIFFAFRLLHIELDSLKFYSRVCAIEECSASLSNGGVNIYQLMNAGAHRNTLDTYSSCINNFINARVLLIYSFCFCFSASLTLRLISGCCGTVAMCFFVVVYALGAFRN